MEDSDPRVTARLSVGLEIPGSPWEPYWGAIAVCVRVSAPAVGFLRLGACRVWGALLEPSVAPGCPLHTHTLGLIFSSSLPCSQPRSLQAAQAPGGQAHCPGLPWVVPTLSPPATLAQGPHVRPVDPNWMWALSSYSLVLTFARLTPASGPLYLLCPPLARAWSRCPPVLFCHLASVPLHAPAPGPASAPRAHSASRFPLISALFTYCLSLPTATSRLCRLCPWQLQWCLAPRRRLVRLAG